MCLFCCRAMPTNRADVLVRRATHGAMAHCSSSALMGRDYEQVRQDLAHNMKSLRHERSLSQEALALSADVDRTYVSQIEQAVGNPSLLVLCKLASILGTDVLNLLERPR